MENCIACSFEDLPAEALEVLKKHFENRTIGKPFEKFENLLTEIYWESDEDSVERHGRHVTIYKTLKTGGWEFSTQAEDLGKHCGEEIFEELYFCKI